ncbi:FAD-dependent oxidoreductase [Actinokineospora globicatena]|uniref:FAD-dependent oxidoreductase n=1 Tax=Actinokineospora globicatena TaxID=103729 RepID=UPI0020A5D71F|nr:FAD-dependent oxidoreductase [Actinokineospora globicatena]MCP2305108.1 2-polyprenyl-6-methoxyphenol hydroxylase [Actinokineospora globicatena]GLW80574.1 monooxygenase [Actinokineospora globicatena]GLW87402.1 monooxygenase [Actinokineospora globicatena]
MATVAVVGGGIAGLATAIGLEKRGWRVSVFERATEFTEVGAGISLWRNALRALDALGLGDQVRARGVGPGGGGLRDKRGRWLASASDNDLVILHRADLLEVLLGAVKPDALRAGTPVDRLEVVDGKPVINGERFDLLVGADGLRSTVRATFWPDAEPPRPTGHTAWRMVLPAAGVTPSETWGDRQVFGIFPMSGDRVYAYAAAVVPPDTVFPDGDLAELRRRFADWHDPIPTLVNNAETALRHDLYYLPDLSSYVRGPVALVGDAAHAMPPNMGQGGCQALEDAVTLAATADDLAHYDALRRPRSQSIARRSISTGKFVHSGAPWRDTLVRLLPASLVRRAVDRALDWYPPVAPLG